MSRDDTAKITSVCEGNCFSIFFVWRSCGSFVEKKKFSSTTGLRSTKAATTPKSTTVTSSIHQCAPNKPGLLTMEKTTRFELEANETCSRVPWGTHWPDARIEPQQSPAPVRTLLLLWPWRQRSEFWRSTTNRR